MAVRKTSIEQQMQRIKLKREELDLRLRSQETRDKLREVKARLKSTGGRIR